MSLNSGERQVATRVADVRRDHVARYEFVAKALGEKSRVIDYACGIGYGCRVLADSGHIVTGVDIDRETIQFAQEHYSIAKYQQIGQPECIPVNFMVGNGSAPGALGEFDAAVCFETVEHIEDPRPLLLALREASPALYVSVPNEDVLPWQHPDGRTTAFHFRHYTKFEFKQLLEECGWRVTDWYGQEGPNSEVESDCNGRTLIAICERTSIPERLPNQKRIAIVGLGGSVDAYTDVVKRAGGRSRLFDQVWCINALGNVFDCDLIFHMDDIRIQSIRAEARPDSNIATMVEWLKTSKTPVMTSRGHPDYPALIEFPLEDALNILGNCYFNNTAAYAIAYAIMVEATDISLFGMDYTYPNRHDAEKGRACVEFWLGVAHARGIRIGLPVSTTLMDANVSQESRMYGYDTLKVVIDPQMDGSVKLQMSEISELPSAQEIEARYDHSAPVEKQHVR